MSYWDTIKNSNNPDDFKSYLDKYPDGQFAALAKSRSQPARASSNSPSGDSNSMELVYWNAIKDSKNPSDFKAYATKFPNGLFVEISQVKPEGIPLERAADLMKQIGRALSAAHDKGIFHRDLKPEKHHAAKLWRRRRAGADH